MSTRKRPLRELQTSQTPARYAPSTPHAIRALQQRSGAKTRTLRKRALSDNVRPDSARGILRQLAKLTAPTTKRLVPTPGTVKGKENQLPEENDDRLGKKPRMTLNIDDSLDSIEAPEIVDEDEDSEVPAAPTPSILPDDNEDHLAVDENDPTFTLKSIKHGRDAPSPDNNRRVTRPSFPASDPVVYQDGDEELTFLSERGRRAPTVEPTEALSQYDFGEFNMDEEQRRQQSKSPEKSKLDLVDMNISYASLEDGGEETEALKHLSDLHRSLSLPPPDETNVDISAFDDTNFQLPEPNLEATSNQVPADSAPRVKDALLAEHSPQHGDDAWESEHESDAGPEAEPDAGLDEESVAEQLNKPQPMRTISSKSSQTRRNKLKLTRHGEMVPSLPSNLIRRVAIEAQERLGNRRPKLGKDHMKALEQATEWFFEQVGEDLGAYSNHARGRKRISQSDVMLLMRRQRILQGECELLNAAKEFLPEEEVAKLKLPG